MSLSQTTIYLVRHGESEWNIKNFVQGQSTKSNPLTATGKKQAALIANELRHIPFNKIVSSDLERAYQTATIIAQTYNLPVTKVPDLREQTHGKYEGTDASAYLKLFTKWYQLSDEERHVYKVIEDGETNKDVTTRLKTFILKTAASNPGETILMVTHSGMMRYFLISEGYGTYDSIQGFHHTGYISLVSDGNTLQIKEVIGVKRAT